MRTFVSVLLLSTVLGIVFSFPTTDTTEPTFSLEENLKRIYSLLPCEKYKTIAEAHLKNDTGFRAAVKYMQGDEWQNLLLTVRAHPDTVKFKAYLRNLGLDVDEILKKVDEYINSVKIGDVPPEAQKNLRSFLIEIEENTPIVKIIAALNENMMNKNFQDIYEHLASKESREIFENFRSIPEVKKMIEELKGLTENNLLKKRRKRSQKQLDVDLEFPVVKPVLGRIFNNNVKFNRDNFLYLNKTKTVSVDESVQHEIPKSRVSKAPTLQGRTYHELFENRNWTIGPNMYTVDDDYFNRLKKLLKEAGVDDFSGGVALP